MTTTIRPLDDRVLIRPKAQENVYGWSKIVIPETADREVPNEGTVVAVGPGQWTIEPGKATTISRSVRRKPDIQVGDTVIYVRHVGVEVKADDEILRLVKASEVLAIVERG